MTTVRTYLLVLILTGVFWFWTTFASTFDLSLACWSTIVEGSLATSDFEKTTITMTIENDQWVVDSSTVTLENTEEYTLEIDPTKYEEWLYTITLVATLWDKSSKWSYKTYLWDDCDSLADIKERMVVYAETAKEYFDNVENEQVIPNVFLATGLLNRLDETIKKTKATFAVGWSNTYHTLPEWTVGPFLKQEEYPEFEEQYALLPDEYRWAQAYLHFKWLLVPIVLPEWAVTEAELLSRLNSWMLLAPETPSFDSIGNVKMLYSHSLSYTDSPFAGIWSYLSLYTSEWDIIKLYIKKWYVSYETRVYTIKNKLQITPEQTSVLTWFKKPWVDSFALITCRDGDVLGSTEWREVLLLERNFDDLNAFEKTMVRVNNIPTLAEQAEQFDAYLKEKKLTEEESALLVKELEKAEKDEDNSLYGIAIYGKYRASYDALYE